MGTGKSNIYSVAPAHISHHILLNSADMEESALHSSQSQS